MQSQKVFISIVVTMFLVLMVQVGITTASWEKTTETKHYADKIITQSDSLKAVNDSIVKANRDLVFATTSIVTHYDSLKHQSDSLFNELWVVSMEKQRYEVAFTIFAKYYPQSAQKFAYIMSNRIK